MVQDIPNSDDPFNLRRFISAQDGTYEKALGEIKSGRKRSHWIWFIFPQFAGLGTSSTNRHYSIKSLEEARQYLAHPLLGRRLIECSEAVLAIEGRSISEIFETPDDLKLRSSMTLFANVAKPGSIFSLVLEKYFLGLPDSRTLQLIDRLD